MRQFILQKNPDKKGLIKLFDKDYRYLCQVLRVKQGDMLDVRLPDGNLQKTTVAQIDQKGRVVTLQICADPENSNKEKSITRGVQADEISNMGKIEYWLFQFIPKPQKFEQIVRQATECGVKYIVPVISEYTEKSSVISLQGSKKERIEKIVKEARQQSGSAVDTVVCEPMTLDQACKKWEECEKSGPEEKALGIVLSERNDNTKELKELFLSYGDDKQKINRICITVGNEGGVSPEEIEKLTKKSLFLPVHFDVNILRCETAALYGIASLQTFVSFI